MRQVTLLLVLLLSVGCGGGGGKESSPTTTSPTPVTPPASSAPPVAKLSCSLDGTGITLDRAYALVGGSLVTCDATGSSGEAAKVVINFGDGYKEEVNAATPTATHTFMAKGSYVVDVTVTDAYKRVAGASQTIVAKPFLGYWSGNGTVGALGTGVHRLAFDSQTGSEIVGRYKTPAGKVYKLTGIVGCRYVHFTLENGTVLSVSVPFRFEQQGFNICTESGEALAGFWPAPRW